MKITFTDYQDKHRCWNMAYWAKVAKEDGMKKRQAALEPNEITASFDLEDLHAIKFFDKVIAACDGYKLEIVV